MTYPEILTISEVAELTRLSISTIRNAINGKTQPQLPAIKIGRRRLVSKDELITWLRLCQGVSLSEPQVQKQRLQ